MSAAPCSRRQQVLADRRPSDQGEVTGQQDAFFSLALDRNTEHGGDGDSSAADFGGVSLGEFQLKNCTCQLTDNFKSFSERNRSSSRNRPTKLRRVHECALFHRASYVQVLPWRANDVVSSSTYTVLSIVVYLFCVSTLPRVCLAGSLPSAGVAQPFTHCPVLECVCEPSSPNVEAGSVAYDSPPSSSSSIGDHSHRLLTVNVTCANQSIHAVPDFASSERNMDIRLLNLSGNELGAILSKPFVGIKGLKVLDLASNHIQVIKSSVFSTLENLTHLYLDHNDIEHLDADLLHHLSKLIYLDLSHNRLSSIPAELFQHTPNLSGLDLHNNDLVTSTQTTLGVSRDHKLAHKATDTVFSDTESVTAFISLETLPRLSFLNLSSNSLTFLTDNHLNILLNKVHVLDLSGNPFTCDCSVLSMVRWLRTNVKDITPQWIFPRCSYPESLSSVDVTKLTLEHLKTSCDQMTNCDNLESCLATSQSQKMAGTQMTWAQDTLTTAAAPVNSTRMTVYESMLLPYDPMLGWYTAATLGGLVAALILCLLCDKAKQKIAQYRRRRWRRIARKKWEASKLAGAGENDLMDSFPLQYQTPVFYSNEIRADPIPTNTSASTKFESQELRQLSSTTTSSPQEKNNSSFGSNNQVSCGREHENTASPRVPLPPRRLSVSWGPNSNISKAMLPPSGTQNTTPPVSPWSPGSQQSNNLKLTSNNDLELASALLNNGGNDNVNMSSSDLQKGTESPLGANFGDLGESKELVRRQSLGPKLKLMMDDTRQSPPPSQSFLRILEQACEEIQVAQVHPDCPIHNPHKMQKLKTLFKTHPEKSLQEIVLLGEMI